MNFLQKLLDGAHIEWLPLGDVLVRTQGTHITAGRMKELNKAGAPLKIFAGGRTVAHVNFEDIPAKDVKRKASIIVKSRGIIEFDYYDKPFSHKNEMWSYHSEKPETHIKYIYHFLKLNEPYFQKLGSKMQMPQIATPDTDKFLIPIPCPENPQKSLKIQGEIVRILDKLTAATHELQKELARELELRKKQYAFYRDKLLSFPQDDVEWKTLGEIAQYSQTRIDHENLNEETYVGVDNLLQDRAGKSASRHVPTSGRLTEYCEGDILIGNIRPYLKKIWYANSTGGTNGDVLVIRTIDKTVNSRYLYQVLADDKFFEYNMLHARGAKMPRGNKSKILEYSIPIPPLAEQMRIVDILDRFETLTNALQEGLPREIELRKKQYEYYRAELFHF